ncbi:TonB-dependent receptor [Vandammella animalimorsus]|uniref:TonB-dependent receptor n=1 Tax=Vandammella animalimorsus TaxID=2029117 RepID=A0A3M6RKF0_9BURK|nr:TonB-dependent receptor [Vandammella animalimorsus]RMX14842.1 TonB-dependent receptor [Vandammella animalimorsus]
MNSPASGGEGSPGAAGLRQACRDAWLLACLGAALGAAPVAAQDQGGKQAATTLPTVTVQARRADEQARELPFSVQAVDEMEIEQRRITSLEDLLRGTPGVDVNSWGGADNANVRIRGVGSLYQSGEDDASVIVNIDGVPTSVGNAGLGTLDVEQAEVLKGPQGSLFGRNSAAGAINIRTRRPATAQQGGQMEGHARAEAGSGHQHLAEGAINLPLGQAAAARLALRHNAQDYDYVNLNSGRPVSRPRDLSWRASLLWQPQAATEALLRASGHDARRYQSAMLLRPYGRAPGQALSRDGLLDGNQRQIDQYALHLRHDLPWARLVSVTSHERTDDHSLYMTGSEVGQAMMGVGMDQPQLLDSMGKSWSQDLRLSSLPGERVFWVAGLNLFRSRGENRQERINGRFAHSLRHRGQALYGEATWPLGQALKLTTGLRRARERKDYGALYSPAGSSQPTPDSRQLKDSHTSGRLGLSWALAAHTSLYASYARGHKPGGFNQYATQQADSTPYRPGRVDSLELGAKHESVDGRLRLDAALFFNQTRDDHLLAYNTHTLASQHINVDVRSQGLDLDAQWRPGGGFTLGGGLTLIDGKIKNHVVTNTPAGDVQAGNRLPDVPRLSALLSVQWQRALPSFWGLRAPAFHTRLSLRHVGRRAADPQNSFDLDSYRKLDLRLGLVAGNTEFYLWGDNLGDKRYDLYGFHLMPGLNVGMPARGRSFGIGLTHQF